jgi:hypothetical protein
MLHQEYNRLNFGELLIPEEGFLLDFACGMTYSLDLEALLGIPVSLGMFDDLDSMNMKNPFFLLESIRKSSEKIALFCNAGGIKLPQKIQTVFSLLEQSVFEVKLKKKGANFHPKLWIIRYRNVEGKAKIRIIVLSRNLTFDRSFDIAIELTSAVGEFENEKNRPLADMLRFVADYANANPQKAKMIRLLANDVLKIDTIQLEEEYEDVAFYPFGIEGYKNKAEGLFVDANELIIVSPFLSESIIKKLSASPSPKMLITRKNSVSKKILESFDEVYITKESVLEDELLEETNLLGEPSRDIHAKIYFKSTYVGNFLYLGSLNASENAFRYNVEFMLGLKYKPRKAGYKTIRNEFLPEEGCPFERLLVSDPKAVSETEEGKQGLLDVIYAIKSAQATFDGEKYQIEIQINPLESPAKIAPFHRDYELVAIQDKTVLPNLALKELSEFYLIKRDDETCVIKIRTKGIPTDERDDAIYKSMIVDKKSFLDYVAFMLADNYSEAVFEQARIESLFKGTDQKASIPSVSLYEKMLNSSMYQPEKLEAIEDVMHRLDPSIITDDFKELLATFKAVIKKVGKK